MFPFITKSCSCTPAWVESGSAENFTHFSSKIKLNIFLQSTNLSILRFPDENSVHAFHIHEFWHITIPHFLGVAMFIKIRLPWFDNSKETIPKFQPARMFIMQSPLLSLLLFSVPPPLSPVFHCYVYTVPVCFAMAAQLNPRTIRNKAIALYISIIGFADRREEEGVLWAKVNF